MYSLVFDLFTILREKQEDRDRDTLCPPAQIAHAANPELGISAVRTHTHTHTRLIPGLPEGGNESKRCQLKEPTGGRQLTKPRKVPT